MGPKQGNDAASDGECRPRAAAEDDLCNRNLPKDPRTTRKPPTAPWKTSRNPHALDQGVTFMARGELARPWLEAAGPEEAEYPRGEARALRKPAGESRSDYKENSKQKNQVRKTPPKASEKVAPQPRTVKSTARGQ